MTKRRVAAGSDERIFGAFVAHVEGVESEGDDDQIMSMTAIIHNVLYGKPMNHLYMVVPLSFDG